MRRLCRRPHGGGVRRVGQGAHRGALRLERLQRGAMGQQQCAVECGIGGGIFGSARGKGCTIPRQCRRIDGQAPRKSSVRKAETMGPVVRARQRAIGCLRTAGAGNFPTPQWLLVCVRGCRALVVRCPRRVSTHHVWPPPSRGRHKQHMLRAFLPS